MKSNIKWFTRKRIMMIAGGTLGVVMVFTAILLSLPRMSNFQLALNNMSEMRFFMKTADSASYRVQFYSGMREQNYVVDGMAGKTVAYAIVNVEPKTNNLLSRSYIEGVLKIGDDVIEVKLNRNPFDKNFTADIGRLVERGSRVSFTLNVGTPVIFDLVDSMNVDSISWEDALRVAAQHMGNKLQKIGRFETYVKILSPTVSDARSFWYVYFVTAGGETFFCVIDSEGNCIHHCGKQPVCEDENCTKEH
jgi:hypothetical protein